MDKKLKILAICGSPRRGNTYNILSSLKEDNPEIEFKILMLSDLNLNDCLGCYACMHCGEDCCPLTDDDRDMIIEEMLLSDATIFASPTYARTISALMKKFVERISFFAHRPIFFEKYAMALTTCAGFGGDLTCKFLEENFTQCGFNFVSSLVLRVATMSEKEKEFNLKESSLHYNKLISVVKSAKKPEPTLGQLVYFRIMKKIAELNKKIGKADFEFYKDKKDFYHAVKVSYPKKLFAKWVADREINKLMKNR